MDCYPVMPGTITRVAPSLPRLKAIELWDGGPLDREAGASIRTYCPYFRRLSIYRWSVVQSLACAGGIENLTFFLCPG